MTSPADKPADPVAANSERRSDPQAVAAPRTRRGQFLLEELPGLIRGGWTPFREEQWTGTILAIEAEARQQMKAETRERIFRDNGLIADPLAAASPAAPAVDVDLLQEAMERASGLLNMHFGPGRVPGWGVVAKYIAAEYQRLQDTVDPVAT